MEQIDNNGDLVEDLEKTQGEEEKSGKQASDNSNMASTPGPKGTKRPLRSCSRKIQTRTKASQITTGKLQKTDPTPKM